VHAGVQLAAAVFEAHAPARPEIFDLLQARLLAGGRGEAALPWLALLARLIRRQPDLMSAQATPIKASALLAPVLL
jgi:hypothetical protein